jgi:hypothetical protein
MEVRDLFLFGSDSCQPAVWCLHYHKCHAQATSFKLSASQIVRCMLKKVIIFNNFSGVIFS